MDKLNTQPNDEFRLTLDELSMADTLRKAWQQDLLAPTRIRKRHEISQRQLANTIEVSQVTLSRWEIGQRSPSNYWLLVWFAALTRLINKNTSMGVQLSPDWANEFVRLHFPHSDKVGAMDKTITLRLHSPTEFLPLPDRLVGVVLKDQDKAGGRNDIWLSCRYYSDTEEVFVDNANQDIRVEVSEVDYWFYLPEV